MLCMFVLQTLVFAGSQSNNACPVYVHFVSHGDLQAQCHRNLNAFATLVNAVTGKTSVCTDEGISGI